MGEDEISVLQLMYIVDCKRLKIKPILLHLGTVRPEQIGWNSEEAICNGSMFFRQPSTNEYIMRHQVPTSSLIVG